MYCVCLPVYDNNIVIRAYFVDATSLVYVLTSHIKQHYYYFLFNINKNFILLQSYISYKNINYKTFIAQVT